MKMQTCQFSPTAGWSAPLPAALDSPQTLVLVFGAREMADAPQVFDALAEAFGQSVVVGCSTSGEIAGPLVNDASLSVAVAQFEHTRLKMAVTDIAHAEESGAAGRHLAEQLLAAGTDLQAVFMLSDGLCVNGTPLVAALAGGLPAGVSITGGLAGDGSRFERTWVLAGQRLAAGQVAAIGFYGSRLRVAAAPRAAGWTSGPSGASPSRPAMCCWNWTASLRSTCTRLTWATWPRACPARHCCFRCRSTGRGPTPGHWCAPSWPSTKRGAR